MRILLFLLFCSKLLAVNSFLSDHHLGERRQQILQIKLSQGITPHQMEWKLLNLFCDKFTKEEFIKDLDDQIISFLHRGDLRFANLISFREYLDPKTKNLFHKIFDGVKSHWTTRRNFDFAKKSTEILVHFGKSQAVAAMLQESFSYLFKSNDLEGLLALYPIASAHSIPMHVTALDAQNQIADAEFLLQRGEKKQAELALRWALAIAENEPKAQSLLNSLLQN